MTHHKKRKFRINLDFLLRPLTLEEKANAASILIFLIALFQLFMTYVFPVGPKSDPRIIYSRNITSVLTLFILSFFLSRYYFIHKYKRYSKRVMKTFKVVTTTAAIACAVKAVVSFIYALSYNPAANLVFFYYIGEVFVWAAMAAFLYCYLKRLGKN